jgi:hypothetical protein
MARVQYRHMDGRGTTVPNHAAGKFPDPAETDRWRYRNGPGLMRKILRDVELSSEEFEELL